MQAEVPQYQALQEETVATAHRADLKIYLTQEERVARVQTQVAMAQPQLPMTNQWEAVLQVQADVVAVEVQAVTDLIVRQDVFLDLLLAAVQHPDKTELLEETELQESSAQQELQEVLLHAIL